MAQKKKPKARFAAVALDPETFAAVNRLRAKEGRTIYGQIKVAVEHYEKCEKK